MLATWDAPLLAPQVAAVLWSSPLDVISAPLGAHESLAAPTTSFKLAGANGSDLVLRGPTAGFKCRPPCLTTAPRLVPPRAPAAPVLPRAAWADWKRALAAGARLRPLRR